MIRRYVGRPFLAAFLIAGGDSLGLLLGVGSIVRPTLVLVLFLEGGLGLLLGVIIALSSSPSVSKFGETLFGTARWSRDAEKYSEKEGWRWMIGSSVLVLIGVLLSII